MLRFIRQLLGKNQPQEWPPVPTDFPVYATRAIHLLTASDGYLEDAHILALFEDNGIPRKEAVELLLFLPIAFCRRLLPSIEWPNHYFEYVSEEKVIKRLFTANKRYGIIQEALSAYLATGFVKGDYHKIAGRSASFRAINAVLLDKPGTKMKDVAVAPETILY